MAPPEAGNQILIPLFDADTLGQASTVQWSQNLSTRTAEYYALTVDNITTGEQNVLFIAAELYKNSTTVNPKHITRVGELISGGNHSYTHSTHPFLTFLFPLKGPLFSTLLLCCKKQEKPANQCLLLNVKAISSQSTLRSNTVRKTPEVIFDSWSTTTRNGAHFNIASSRRP